MSTTIPTYNGWPNYPTWNVALWMDNDQGSYGYARELTRSAIAEHSDYLGDDYETGTLDRDGAVADLAETLKGWHEEMTPELEGFTADVFGWALGYVDWRHIAEHRIDDEVQG
jgi:hypothetical protein